MLRGQVCEMTNLPIFNFFLLTAAKVIVAKFWYFQFFLGTPDQLSLQIGVQPSDQLSWQQQAPGK